MSPASVPKRGPGKCERQGAKHEYEAAALPTSGPGFHSAEQKVAFWGKGPHAGVKGRSDESTSRDLERFSSHRYHIIGKHRSK